MRESTKKMELENSTIEELKQCGLNLIEEQGEVLIKIRFPYQAGSKGFFIIKNKDEFVEFISKREARESISIYKVVEKIIEGRINIEFIENVLTQLDKPKYTDWLIIPSGIYIENDNWNYKDTKEELKETLELCLGQDIQILEDPEFVNEDLIIHAYIPDEDGIVRPGAY